MYNFNEDHEAVEVITRLGKRIHLDVSDLGGERKLTIHKGFRSSHLYRIERFVKEIEQGRTDSFAIRYDGVGILPVLQKCHLGKVHYPRLNDWIEHYSDLYRYSAHVEVFYDACKELGLLGTPRFAFGQPDTYPLRGNMRYMDIFDRLIESIRVRCQAREFKERKRLRLLNAERNKQNVIALEEGMFDEQSGRSRWLILSLTLRYKPEYRDQITPELIQEHRDRLFGAKRTNKLIGGIVNQVWAIEQGEDTGLHLHVILFYSADHNHDEHIAKLIGEYWVEVVTKGMGDYWNSNAGALKAGYKKRGHGIGVGQINWNDAEKRDALRTNLVYLAKAEQYLMLKSADRVKAFGMGELPQKVKSGRPRIDLEASHGAEVATILP
ncbi:inovirus Gp2 family protein [Pandoraea apista]|nr:inovirus Gp2 family protein [Pandoraea apista]RRW96720.1 inovirus Gp2 family protein [Pandoraea apista]